MLVLVLQELPDLLRPPEGSGACADFADVFSFGRREIFGVLHPRFYTHPWIGPRQAFSTILWQRQHK